MITVNRHKTARVTWTVSASDCQQFPRQGWYSTSVSRLGWPYGVYPQEVELELGSQRLRLTERSYTLGLGTNGVESDTYGNADFFLRVDNR